MPITKIIAPLFIFLFSFPVNAKLNDQQKDAVKKTQKLLRSSSQRSKVIKESSKAQAAHNKALNLLGNQKNVDKAYDMAAQMLEVIANEADGDAQKMTKILDAGKQKPAALAERMPAQFKKMLKEMASEIESNSSPMKK